MTGDAADHPIIFAVRATINIQVWVAQVSGYDPNNLAALSDALAGDGPPAFGADHPIRFAHIFFVEARRHA